MGAIADARRSVYSDTELQLFFSHAQANKDKTPNKSNSVVPISKTPVTLSKREVRRCIIVIAKHNGRVCRKQTLNRGGGRVGG